MDGGAVKRILRIGWFKRNLLLPQLHLKRERERVQASERCPEAIQGPLEQAWWSPGMNSRTPYSYAEQQLPEANRTAPLSCCGCDLDFGRSQTGVPGLHSKITSIPLVSGPLEGYRFTACANSLYFHTGLWLDPPNLQARACSHTWPGGEARHPCTVTEWGGGINKGWVLFGRWQSQTTCSGVWEGDTYTSGLPGVSCHRQPLPAHKTPESPTDPASSGNKKIQTEHYHGLICVPHKMIRWSCTQTPSTQHVTSFGNKVIADVAS